MAHRGEPTLEPAREDADTDGFPFGRPRSGTLMHPLRGEPENLIAERPAGQPVSSAFPGNGVQNVRPKLWVRI